jgi:ECF sigma factor
MAVAHRSPFHGSRPMSDVTHILSQIESGDPVAAEQLLPLVYDELRKLAAAKLAQEKPGQTLQATALVHEAYVRLVTLPSSAKPNNTDQSELWNSRGHFFAAAAEAMRRILVVHEALEALAAESPAKADLVKLRYFVGMSHQEAADALGISRATADRYWAYAKAFLYASLEDGQKILRKSPRG